MSWVMAWCWAGAWLELVPHFIPTSFTYNPVPWCFWCANLCGKVPVGLCPCWWKRYPTTHYICGSHFALAVTVEFGYIVPGMHTWLRIVPRLPPGMIAWSCTRHSLTKLVLTLLSAPTSGLQFFQCQLSRLAVGAGIMGGPSLSLWSLVALLCMMEHLCGQPLCWTYSQPWVWCQVVGWYIGSGVFSAHSHTTGLGSVRLVLVSPPGVHRGTPFWFMAMGWINSYTIAWADRTLELIDQAHASWGPQSQSHAIIRRHVTCLSSAKSRHRTAPLNDFPTPSPAASSFVFLKRLLWQ